MLDPVTAMPSPGSTPEWDQADRLSKALQHRGIKVQEMADYLGVSRNTIGNYLSRRSKPDKRTVLLWSMKTGVPREWIENGTITNPDNGGGDLGNPDIHQYPVLHILNSEPCFDAPIMRDYLTSSTLRKAS